MSGQLVGEVIAASAALRARGLSERGFHALVAIAEKCHADTRQASVRWEHIQAGLFGASKRTAERAVFDLKSAGVLRVVRRGFDNQNGRICAPIYRIEPLTEHDTQVSQSPRTEHDTAVSERTRQNGDRTRHPGVVLDGSIDGSLDGRGAPAHEPPNPTTVPDPSDNPPPRHCPKHKNGTDNPCGHCADARRRHEEWQTAHDAKRRTETLAALQAITNCPHCDGNGWLTLTDNTVTRCTHNIRTLHPTA